MDILPPSTIAELELVDGSLASGRCTLRIRPRCDDLRILVSGRAMGNLRALIPWGEPAESHVFTGLVGTTGGILLSVTPPLTEQALFRLSDGILTIDAPAPIAIACSDHGLTELLLDYGRRWPAARPGTAIIGWNSWDCLGPAVDHDTIETMLAAIDTDPLLSSTLTHVVIDDGWQTTWGDWRPNGKFPSGMDGIADRIHAHGRKAGLWLAPLVAEPLSQLYLLHPDCFLHDRCGHPILCEQGLCRSFYALDVSVARTREFLRRSFADVRRWGYDYVKLDFLVNHAEAISKLGGHSPAGWTSNRHIAEMLMIARQELGHAHILACNHPFELGSENTDEVRIGSDIGPFWENVFYAYNAWVSRFFLAGSAIRTDPDFALVRVPERTWTDGAMPFHWTPPWLRDQAPGGWRRGSFWSLDEMRFSLALVMMSGGSMILGDWLPQLNAEGRRHLGISIDLGGGTPAAPLDLDGARPLPCLFRNDRALFVFNPFATPITLTLPVGSHLAPDVFTGVAPGPTIITEPHSCYVFPLITP